MNINEVNGLVHDRFARAQAVFEHAVVFRITRPHDIAPEPPDGVLSGYAGDALCLAIE